jgi:hypothetical protein
VRKEFKTKHYFATAKCSWSSGIIKSTCRQDIFAFRAVLSELKMYADEWPEVINLVSSVLINSLSSSAARTNVVFTNFYVDNNSSLISE